MHKIGKKWVVVSAVLLGLLGGGSAVVSANTTTSIQPTVTTQACQAKNNVKTVKPTVQSNASASISGSNAKTNAQITNASYASSNAQSMNIESALASSEAMQNSDDNINTSIAEKSIGNDSSGNSMLKSFSDKAQSIASANKKTINDLNNGVTPEATGLAKRDQCKINSIKKTAQNLNQNGIQEGNSTEANSLAGGIAKNDQAKINGMKNDINNLENGVLPEASGLDKKDQNIVKNMKSGINSLEQNGTNSANSLAGSITKSASNNIKSAHNALNSLNQSGTNPVADSIANSMAKSGHHALNSAIDEKNYTNSALASLAENGDKNPSISDVNKIVNKDKQSAHDQAIKTHRAENRAKKARHDANVFKHNQAFIVKKMLSQLVPVHPLLLVMQVQWLKTMLLKMVFSHY